LSHSLELRSPKIARARPALTRLCASLTCAQCAFWSIAQRSASIGRLNFLVADAPTGLSHESPSALVILLGKEDLATLEAGGAPRPSWVDPSGADHRLYTWPGPYPASGTHQQQSGAYWDYCTPAPKKPKAAPKTAHGGRCAWRGDLYERYEKDEAFDSKTGVIDLDKVPARDRFAMEAMYLFKANPKERTLCTETENSKPATSELSHSSHSHSHSSSHSHSHSSALNQGVNQNHVPTIMIQKDGQASQTSPWQPNALDDQLPVVSHRRAPAITQLLKLANRP